MGTLLTWVIGIFVLAVFAGVVLVALGGTALMYRLEHGPKRSTMLAAFARVVEAAAPQLPTLRSKWTTCRYVNEYGIERFNDARWAGIVDHFAEEYLTFQMDLSGYGYVVSGLTATTDPQTQMLTWDYTSVKFAHGDSAKAKYQWIAAALDQVIRAGHGADGAASSVQLDDVVDGLEYEEAVFSALAEMGFRCTRTPPSGDQGVDLIVRGGDGSPEMSCAIQCKRYSGSVGNSAVQEVVAGMRYYGCATGAVVTNSVFTRAARDLAAANGVILCESNNLAFLGNELSHLK